MRVAIARGLFPHRFSFTTSDDDGECVCDTCGAVVRNQQAHRRFHEALQYVARDAEQGEAASHRSRRPW